MPGDAELGRDVKQGSIPHDGAETHVNGAQYPIGVWYHEICSVRIAKVGNVEPCRDRGRWTDRERGPHPGSGDI